MSDNIGLNLKIFRKKSNLSLKELSEKTDISISLLSNIERGLRSPTIINLQKICKALNITINELLIATEEKYVIKKSERETVFIENHKQSNVLYQTLSQGERSLKGMCMIIDDDRGRHQSFGHKVDEFGIVISGSMEMFLGDTEYILEEGDSIYIPAGFNHSFKKLSTEKCISYWIISNDPENSVNVCDN